MKRRVLSRALSLSLVLGAAMVSSCTPSGDRTTSASALRHGHAFKHGLYAKPKIERHESGARVNPMILSRSNRENTRLIIDVADQKGYLLVDGRIAIETPVSTARPGKWTPRGSFNMTQRVRTGKISTIYGVEMPYWMRLSGSVYGVHAGYLPGYPASAGCIRLPSNAAELIFDNTTYGTKVNVYSSWEGA
ncbi:MAG: L,D-transpeptidase [Verrucomicrobiaceae bacterium]|nr:L,D-transpeptidase [Verrucomicrobiaceae bacterium]